MGRKIMIVEDEVISAMSTRYALEDLGYEVLDILVSGEEAVEAAGSESPSLIIMDIKLAGKMDGIEAARRIKSMSDIPLIYVTAHTDSETVKRAEETGPLRIIDKPVEEYEWEGIMKDAFQGH